jgi:hypothetical protein
VSAPESNEYEEDLILFQDLEGICKELQLLLVQIRVIRSRALRARVSRILSPWR